MRTERFGAVIKNYLTEADVPAPAPDASAPDAGGAPSPDAGGGMPTPDAAGGGLPDLGGGMPSLGGGDPMGGMGGDPMGGGGEGGSATNDICSPKYTKLVMWLVELYNANMTDNKNLVLNIKVKVGKVENLNDEHNAKEIMRFAVDNLLNDDVKTKLNELYDSYKKTYKKFKENKDEFKKMDFHGATESFLSDVAVYAYHAICSSAVGDALPEIDYGIDRQYKVDLKNAKAVFDEIKKNVDEEQKISEVNN